MLINYQRLCAGRQNLQRLQELDHVVLKVCRQSIKRLALSQGLAVVRFYSFPGRRELPMMHKRTALIVKTPEFTGDEFAVPCKESG